MQNTWILVANASEAKLYQNAKRFAPLELVKEFHHPESRNKGSELASDRPGHAQSKGTGHGAFVEATDPKSFEIGRFAKELANELEHGRTANSYARLVLVASPQFLGQLNGSLNDHVRKLVSANIQKDYTRLAEQELLPTLKEQNAL